MKSVFGMTALRAAAGHTSSYADALVIYGFRS
jgi:hypothetical protein